MIRPPKTSVNYREVGAEHSLLLDKKEACPLLKARKKNAVTLLSGGSLGHGSSSSMRDSPPLSLPSPPGKLLQC